jgi:hypothetical protein
LSLSASSLQQTLCQYPVLVDFLATTPGTVFVSLQPVQALAFTSTACHRMKQPAALMTPLHSYIIAFALACLHLHGSILAQSARHWGGSPPFAKRTIIRDHSKLGEFWQGSKQAKEVLESFGEVAKRPSQFWQVLAR